VSVRILPDRRRFDILCGVIGAVGVLETAAFIASGADGWIFGLGAVPMLAVAALGFRAARSEQLFLRLDDEGFTLSTPFNTRTWAWTDISEAVVLRAGFHDVAGFSVRSSARLPVPPPPKSSGGGCRTIQAGLFAIEAAPGSSRAAALAALMNARRAAVRS
jgi:hypothetical protein